MSARRGGSKRSERTHLGNETEIPDLVELGFDAGDLFANGSSNGLYQQAFANAELDAFVVGSDLCTSSAYQFREGQGKRTRLMQR